MWSSVVVILFERLDYCCINTGILLNVKTSFLSLSITRFLLLLFLILIILYELLKWHHLRKSSDYFRIGDDQERIWLKLNSFKVSREATLQELVDVIFRYVLIPRFLKVNFLIYLFNVILTDLIILWCDTGWIGPDPIHAESLIREFAIRSGYHEAVRCLALIFFDLLA